MEHVLRVGQLIKSERFKDARYAVDISDAGIPTIDKMRLSMLSRKNIEGRLFQPRPHGDKAFGFSIDTETNGNFGDCPFKVIAVDLIARHELRLVAEALTGERILFLLCDGDGDTMPYGHVDPSDIELLDGPPDEQVEPVW